ncbi:hypothetical protein [Williamsia sp. R60]
MTTSAHIDPNELPPGDIGLLETDVARELLSLASPARLAYVAADGSPRVFPMNHW